MPDHSDRPEERLDLTALERLSADAPLPRPPRGPILGKVLAFLVPLAVLTLVPWFLISRMRNEPVRPSTAATQTPTASASVEVSATPSATPAAGFYEVTVSENCLRVRESPGLDGDVVDCLGPGYQVTSDGVLRDIDAVGWMQIRYGKKTGWVAERYLKKTG